MQLLRLLARTTSSTGGFDISEGECEGSQAGVKLPGSGDPMHAGEGAPYRTRVLVPNSYDDRGRG